MVWQNGQSELSKPWRVPCSFMFDYTGPNILIAHCGPSLRLFCRIYNNLPSKVKNGLCPEEVFAGIILWLSMLCSGPETSRWEEISEPHARAGKFLGFPKEHSSKVSLVRNLRTGRVTPQFHVVFDELFHTVTTEMEIDLEETWIDLYLDSTDYYIQNHDPETDPPIPPLDEEWESQKQDVEVPVVETVPEDQNVQSGYLRLNLFHHSKSRGHQMHHHLMTNPNQKTMEQYSPLQGESATLTVTFIWETTLLPIQRT